jgi:alpha-amylase/alpha-mannosidase (GH57 family)
MKDPSAVPYHDWNECVYEQCYKPNRAARLLNSNNQISYITNNYRHLSFNVGPTLHSWIEKIDPALSRFIVEADKDAASALGEGGAIAQAYNHMILPLAAERDIKTQVAWGIKDFSHRFGRVPKGMWLPETAVDTRTLEALAACGIEFTILAPHQCAEVRPPEGEWRLTPGGEGLDVTRPYYMRLPSGRKISLIFYLGSIAHDIAFGGLLDNGDFFADALLGKLPRDSEPRLLTIATDGETYGHHHRYGEMALARAAQRLCASQDSVMTNAAAFLSRFPARWECKIAENTSWSCAHGLERWRGNCGCHTGGEPNWHQMWRGPLREALDRLRDKIDEAYETEMKRYCDDPWQLRDEAASLYLMDFSEDASIDEVLSRKAAFLKDFCGELEIRDARNVLTLIEMQRMRMFMYTSCGWFFNDISGIETRQIMAYALRASEYLKDVTGITSEGGLLNDLKKAQGNTAAFPTGYDVMMKTVMPQKRSVEDIAALSALMSKNKAYYSYRIKSGGRAYPSGDMGLSVARMSISDMRTLETWKGASVVLSTGGLDDVCRLSDRDMPSQKEIWSNFYAGDLLSTSRYIESAFELGPWHFRDLPQDDRDNIAYERTKYAERDQMEYAEDLLADNRRLLVQLGMMGVGSPPFLQAAVSFVYEQRMKELASDVEDILDLLGPESRLEMLLEEAHSMNISPELSVLAPAMESAFYDKLISAKDTNDAAAFESVLLMLRRAGELRIDIGKWRIQNAMWDILFRGETELSPVILELASVLGFATPMPARF